MSNGSAIPDLGGLLKGSAGSAQSSSGITTRAFLLNIATGLVLFALEIIGFFILKSQLIGKRIYQPKTYLVQDKLRVEPSAANPIKWLRRILQISDDELRAKCGLDGYFLIRFLRAMLIIFAPLTVIVVTTLLPINFNGGANTGEFQIGGHTTKYNVKGLDRISWLNVAPTHTARYWAHLVCAILTISWVLYRIFREKMHFIKIRQEFLSSPEHRIKASAKTILVANIPGEYMSKEALKSMYDIFVSDDREKLHVWINRDYSSLKKLVNRRRNLCHALEKEELKLLRAINKSRKNETSSDVEAAADPASQIPILTKAFEEGDTTDDYDATREVHAAFDADLQDSDRLLQKYGDKVTQITLSQDDSGKYQETSKLKFWEKPKNAQTMPKVAWLRFSISRLTLEIEEMLQNTEDETRFKRQNSAFIQFDNQMESQMAVKLVAHHLPGRMSPRFFNVAPHEILWPNMGLTSLRRFIRTASALVLFIGLVVLWGIPTTFLSVLSQLQSLRIDTPSLGWLREWPDWVISLISGPGATILLALLVQLIVPALCRKLAVLVGCSTRSSREIVTSRFYFTFLFVELVLVTSISSGITVTVPEIVRNPTSIPNTLASNLPKAANSFFNYLIIQGLGFSGSVLFQYLRLLYITLIWPWFTQTPRQEAWLQTVIPHQMWGNTYPLFANFACIALIYATIAPLILVIITVVFAFLYIAYIHNYFYVQRVKVDTFGMMFQTALSQIMTGVYVGEICLIGLFLLVRDTQDRVVCSPQAIIMIVAVILTVIVHVVTESFLSPLYDVLPVSLEDIAAAAEKERQGRLVQSSGSSVQGQEKRLSDSTVKDGPQDEHGLGKEVSAATTSGAEPAHHLLHGKGVTARLTLGKLRNDITAQLTANEAHALQLRSNLPHRLELAQQLGKAIAGYPDELTDLTEEEQLAELKSAYQDPVTRTPPPTIWIPRDEAGVSEHLIARVESKYGKFLQYSNAGARLTKTNKCEVTRPAPDVRADWLLDWYL